MAWPGRSSLNSAMKGPRQCGLTVLHCPLLSYSVLCYSTRSLIVPGCPTPSRTVHCYPALSLTVAPTLRPAGLVLSAGPAEWHTRPHGGRPAPRKTLSPSPCSSAHPRGGGPRTGRSTQKPSPRLETTGNSARGAAPPWGEAGPRPRPPARTRMRKSQRQPFLGSAAAARVRRR